MHNEEWFDEVFAAHAVAVHRFLRRRLNTTQGIVGADDLTAEVFAIAWRRRADVPDDAALPWLYATARRVAANHFRRASKDSVTDHSYDTTDEAVDVGADPAELVSSSDELTSAWRQLSARDRQVLALVAWEGLTEAEISVVLDMSVGGASAAISRARQRLSEQLEG
ncbi:MAG: sigma-70 family RNA polymerase sigma factor [Candidatus Nanopelagicales bacterium]